MSTTPQPLLHVSLDTSDLAGSVAFHRVLLGQGPFLERPDYARFVTSAPGLVLGLNAVEHPPGSGGPLQHLGIAFPTTTELELARGRLASAGFASADEGDVVCCYGRLTRLWATDRASGTRWELFVPIEERVEASSRGSRPGSGSALETSCCARAS